MTTACVPCYSNLCMCNRQLCLYFGIQKHEKDIVAVILNTKSKVYSQVNVL